MENYPGKQIVNLRVPQQVRTPYMGFAGFAPPYDIPLTPPLAIFTDGTAAYALDQGLILLVTPQPFDPGNISCSITMEAALSGTIGAWNAYGLVDYVTPNRAPANSQILVATYGVDVSAFPPPASGLMDLPFSFQAYKINLAPPPA